MSEGKGDFYVLANGSFAKDEGLWLAFAGNYRIIVEKDEGFVVENEYLCNNHTYQQFMAEYNLHDLHNVMLGILKAIDETCKKYNLRYFIVAGTQLGAVRHKGFIPWDDDADVCMPHSDYDQLIAHSKEWLPEGYELICAENDKHYPQPFAKMQDARTTIIEHAHLRYLGGVYVDVFPLDGMPNNRLCQWLHVRHYKHLCKLLYFTYRDPYRHGHGPSSWLPLLCRKLFTVEGLQKSISRLLHKYDYDRSRYVLCFDDDFRSIVPREVYGDGKPYTFESLTLRGAADSHWLLTKMYGDYMTPPKQGTEFQHNFYYLDLEHSYKDAPESLIQDHD